MALDGKKSFFEQEREELAMLEQKGTKKMLKWYDFGSLKLREEIKRRPGQYFFLFLSTFLGSVITSSVAIFGFSGTIIAQFTAPHLQANNAPPAVMATKSVVETEKYDHLLLASKLRKNEADFVLVDIRPEKEYNEGHIVTAVNIPVYGTRLVTKEGDLEADSVLQAFSVAKGDNLIVIYGPNSYATLPNEISSILNKTGSRAKPLAVGWEEWLHLQGN